MSNLRERCEVCQAVAVNGYPLLHADTCAFSRKTSPAPSAVGAVERAGGAPQMQVPPPAADATGLVVSIAKLLAEVDGYAPHGTQQNEVSRKFAMDALRLSRDPKTKEAAQRRYEAACNVIGRKA